MQQYNDTQLLELILQYKGSEKAEKAFECFYQRHATRIYRYCCRILDNVHEAEDIVQESFIEFLRYVQNNTIQNIPAVLLRIARNLCLNSLRKNREILLQPELILNSAAEYAQYQDGPDQEDLSTLIPMALTLLPEEFREALILQVYHGMSYQEIASFTGVPLTTVRNRIARGKSRLRDILQPHRQDSLR